MLNDLCNLLEQIKSNLKTENILQADTTYIKNVMDKNDFYKYNKFPYISVIYCMLRFSYDENEIGFNAGTILGFLAELLPYNNYLNTFLSTNRTLYLQKEIYEDIYINCEADITGFRILEKVVNILKVAGEIVSIILYTAH